MTAPLVAIVDDHDGVRASIRLLLESAGFRVAEFSSALDYLEAGAQGDCLLADVRMPRMSGLELQEELVRRRVSIPVIVVTGHGDIPLAVRAMRAGASDFLEKPFDDEVLLAAIQRALARPGDGARGPDADTESARAKIALLTGREREVLEQLVLGKSNKLVAHALGISPRTVEIHRARLQDKMDVHDLSGLVRTARAAGQLH